MLYGSVVSAKATLWEKGKEGLSSQALETQGPQRNTVNYAGRSNLTSRCRPMLRNLNDNWRMLANWIKVLINPRRRRPLRIASCRTEQLGKIITFTLHNKVERSSSEEEDEEEGEEDEEEEG
uniref:Uncharacterized protein n=1 Tax=Vespula pensylvanica TaxID=30213 RepID=A0A834JLV3_VESPE|nr:hypothetical protein H0235_017694 [Vespula pensylvanica]